MNSEAIRETYLSFFEERGHLRVPSASLIPASDDPSVLLTTAGMQPFQPYYLGREQPPAPRLASCQRCFRTPDIEEVGSTARHLTCFEMLGNFAFGDYFKEEAIAFAWELSLGAFGFDAEEIWVTVFGGDDELGLGPDDRGDRDLEGAGRPRGADRPAAALGELLAGRAPRVPAVPARSSTSIAARPSASPDDRPGDDSDRFLEYWNLVFTAYDLHEDGSLSELPAKNIDTGLGLERMAAIKQGVDSVFDTDLLRPLVDLAAELSGRPYAGSDAAATRAMRIIADHVRGSVQLIADGVVPSNERRGYVLRRIMRRAIYQGRVLGLEPPYLGRFAERAIEMLAPVNPALIAEREAIMRWINDEEESFGRTLDRGSQLLERLIAEAVVGEHVVDLRRGRLRAARHLRIPLRPDPRAGRRARPQRRRRGLRGADGAAARAGPQSRWRRGGGGGPRHGHRVRRLGAGERASSATRTCGPTPGSSRPRRPSGRGSRQARGQPLLRGGRRPGGRLRQRSAGRAARRRSSTSTASAPTRRCASAAPPPRPGSRVEAAVAHFDRHATMRNHTATHLLHAALRERLGTHVRQAGSAVRPDKLRFDFTHGARLTPEELAAVGERVNGWIKESAPVRAIEMDRVEAERLGAMALFGEKYGDWVRVVEVEGVSRELCGGTHVANTAEIGIFEIVSEGSSASNVRRIEAVTGPAAIDLFRERSDELARTGEALGGRDDPAAAAERMAARLRELEAAAAERGAEAAGNRAAELARVGRGDRRGSASSSASSARSADARALLGPPTTSSRGSATPPSSSRRPAARRCRWSASSAPPPSSAASRRPTSFARRLP